jgi:hypothetical protein
MHQPLFSLAFQQPSARSAGQIAALALASLLAAGSSVPDGLARLEEARAATAPGQAGVDDVETQPKRLNAWRTDRQGNEPHR